MKWSIRVAICMLCYCMLLLPVSAVILGGQSIGITVDSGKSRMSGVGTITFYDSGCGCYAALGHPLGTGLVPITSGVVYITSVEKVMPSTEDSVGSKFATKVGSAVGNVLENGEFGVYGQYFGSFTGVEVPIGTATPGGATMYTVIDGQVVREYKVIISDVKAQTSKAVKGFTIKIVDTNLINAAGGIVQGMSGSPIVQGGKLVGAVTHVTVQNPIKGYGLHARFMVDMMWEARRRANIQ